MRSPRFLGVLLLLANLPGSGFAGRSPARAPTLIIATPSGEERTVQAGDLAFVFYERTYYTRRAPRSEDVTGRRIDVEDRRRECRCLRFEDWAKIKFKRLRQIEIIYPPGERAARLRLTHGDGRLRELPVDVLFGGSSAWPPRFAASIEGTLREFPLRLEEDREDEWPAERLVRILLMRPRPARPSEPSRRR